MRHLLLALAVLWVCSCGKHVSTPKARPVSPELQAKYDIYARLAPAAEGAFADDCDGLLFASLLAAGAGQPLAVEDYRGEGGEYYRSPHHDACGPTSRDMYLGLFWYLWGAKRVDLTEQVFNYGLAHAFVMDNRDKTLSYLLEDEQFTLALVAHRLGGKDYQVWRLPTPCTGSLSGFQAHLQSLVIGLRVLMNSGDTANEKCVKAMVEAHPDNAWFAALAGVYSGDQSRTVALLLAPTYFPADRLPTSAERCEPWLWQRDKGKDWEPCPDENKTHSGGDFLLAAAVALGRLR